MFVVSRMWPVLRVNRRFKNFSWYLRENHSCLQLIKYHVTSIMTKSKNIDGLFIINIYVLKLTFMFLVSRMWPVLRVNRRLKNLSCYSRENHSCLQLIKCHVTSIMSKSNDIDGLFIITIYVIGQNVACFTVNGRFKNLSWYLRENHSCLQLKGYHVTSTVTKLNDIDGLSIITIYVFK